jgi:hypothetical protein
MELVADTLLLAEDDGVCSLELNWNMRVRCLANGEGGGRLGHGV